ncbi:MAG: hypothetical protein R2706_21195 [Acidimicrobiales bacterium]
MDEVESFGRINLKRPVGASSTDDPASSTFAPEEGPSAPPSETGCASGITMVVGKPSRSPWYATPWAWLPADIAMTAIPRRHRIDVEQAIERASVLEGAGELEILELRQLGSRRNCGVTDPNQGRQGPRRVAMGV